MTDFPIFQPTYDPVAVQPMRDELVAVGFEELMSGDDIDRVLGEDEERLNLVVVNSVCGCAAGGARPGATQALQNKTIPDRFYAVFAGQEKEAVAHLREKYLGEYPPSSPAIALFQGSKVVFIMERHDIQGRPGDEIAAILSNVFDKHCKRQGPSISAEAYAQVVHAVACGSKIPLFKD